MTKQLALLVGTPKGAFVVDGDAGRSDWTLRGPLCEGWPIHDVSVEPGTGALLAGGGSPWYGPAVWRSEDLGRTWTHSGEGLTYGDDGPEAQDRLERHGDRRRDLRGRRAGRPVPEPRPRRDLGARRGADEPPDPARMGAGRRRPDPALHRPPPRGPGPRVGRDLGRRRVRDARRRGDVGDAQQGRAGGVPARTSTRSSGSASTSSCMAADGGEHLYQQNHCGVYRSDRWRRASGRRSPPGSRPSSASR